ncbi:hypothetical protein [Halorarius litoreus]|uniref:hypothetical protein n=1 Tax=Halorarius litoreus TaxID=2962676 RepID=UPI0020CCDE7F|nr:hypothetical protein [Halorarius litoreus]
MDRQVPRRAFLVGTTALAGGLAGCSAFGSGANRGGTDTVTPVPLPDADVDPTSIAAVGSRVHLGPLAMAVTGVERTERAVILGREVDPGHENQFLVLDVAFKNASDRYAALVVDRFDVAASGGFYDPVEPFDAFTAPAFGGLAFAPGERRPVRLHYAVPVRTIGVELRGRVRVRSLPDDAFESPPPVVVDLDSSVSAPTRLQQSLRVPVHEPGDTVDAAGLLVRVRRVEAAVDLPNWDPSEGHEHLAIGLAVENGTDWPNAVVVAIGGFGGLAVADARGREFTTTRWFPGEIAGGTYYDEARALAAGESNAGTTVVEVPTDREPLYLTWTPPAALWRVGTGAETNRYVWRLR